MKVGFIIFFFLENSVVNAFINIHPYTDILSYAHTIMQKGEKTEL